MYPGKRETKNGMDGSLLIRLDINKFMWYGGESPRREKMEEDGLEHGANIDKLDKGKKKCIRTNKIYCVLSCIT